MLASGMSRPKLIGVGMIALALLVTSPGLWARTAAVEDVRTIARLYSAAFDRQPKVSGLNFWVDAFEADLSLVAIARRFVDSPEFTSRYGALTDRKYVEQLFLNVLGRAGEQSGTAFWVEKLAEGASRALVLTRFADSPENISKTTALFADMRLVGGQWVFEQGGTFSLRGRMVVPAFAAVDTDTNDPGAPYQSNDWPHLAVAIPNPVTLSGYINEPGTGAPGRSQVPGDQDDYFAVELLAGQVITMLVSDFEIADCDLYLFDANGNFIDASVGIGEIESLVVPADGMYLVNPYAFQGASNYLLIIGNVNIVGAAGGPTVSSSFVPGQAVVRYTSNAALKRGQSAKAMVATDGFSVRAGVADREMLLELDRSAVSSRAAGAASSPASGSKSDLIHDPVDREKWETLISLKALRRNPMVRLAEPNYLVTAAAVPNDEFYPLQWHYPMMNLPAAWDLETGNSSVVVAVIDTGVLLGHPDLQGQLVPGYDFVSGPGSGDGGGIDNNPDDPGDGGALGASSFHGTHVAGTVAARTNNGRGVAGVAWGARVMPVRVLGVGGEGSNYDIIQGIRWAAGLPNDSGTLPARRADVINLSLSGPVFSASEQDAITAARRAGAIIVAAAGNEASAAPSYPASYDGVISVSAVDLGRNLASYSNFGPSVDVAAPGGNPATDLNGDGYPDGVLSTAAEDSSASPAFGYFFQVGTSMATPHVAGTIALMKSANAAITPQQVDQLLATGQLTDDIGSNGPDPEFGYGLINARKAVQAAIDLGASPGSPGNPVLGVTPASLNFYGDTTSIEMTVQNMNTGRLQVTGIVTDQQWIDVIPVEVNSDGVGRYLVSVDRSSLADGIYSGRLTVRSSVNNVIVTIVTSVNSNTQRNNIGHVYALLLDADTNTVIQQLSPQPVNGAYPLNFENVPKGRYNIIAGTDSDNDSFICDTGEACGAYVTIEKPIDIEVFQDLNNLEFPVGYSIALPSRSAEDTKNSKPGRGIYRLEQQTTTGVAR